MGAVESSDDVESFAPVDHERCWPCTSLSTTGLGRGDRLSISFMTSRMGEGFAESARYDVPRELGVGGRGLTSVAVVAPSL